MALTILPSIAYPMIWNIGILWIDQHVALGTPLALCRRAGSIRSMPSPVSSLPLRWLRFGPGRRAAGTEPGSLAKIGIGSAIIGVSALLLSVGSLAAPDGGKVSVFWALAGFFGMGAAFMWYWPVTLALVSKAAPAKVNSTLMGAAFLALFIGTVAMGWVGSFYDQMSPAAFWTLDAGIGFAGALIIFAVRGPLSRLLESDS